MNIPLFFHKTLNKSEQLHFAQQLLSLLHAGLPLLNAMLLLSEIAPKSWKNWLSSLCDDLKKGYSFSYSLKNQDILFSMEFINLIRVSERSGDLALALKTISKQLQAQIELRRKIQQSLAYPIITLVTSFILVIMMMVWVVPVFKEVFEQFKAELPAPTQLLISISTAVEDSLLEILLFLIICIGSFAIAWIKSARLQKYCDQLSFHIPILGNLLRLATLTYWCRTLGHLLVSGLPLPDAIRVTAQSSNHWISHDFSAEIFKNLTRGWPLGDSLRLADPNHLLFDVETLQLLTIGAQSGSLTEMLQKRAETLGVRLSNSLNTLSQTLEPFFILFIGTIIGTLVIILYLPIFNLGQII